MTQKKHAVPSQSLSEVKEQFKTWRKTKIVPGRYPGSYVRLL